MCGIVGYIGSDDALSIIVSGLEKLAYRGYDSSGVAVFEDKRVVVTRALGKLSELQNTLEKKERKGASHLGIGHTRWATHGKPSENNAHPHTAGRISLIHNGIIENYSELRDQLTKEGSVFKSETDTEIAAHLLNKYVSQGLAPLDALRSLCSEIRGSYAFLAIDAEKPDHIMVAKNATPIVIGLGEGEVLVASDIPAILNRTKKVMILEDGDLAVVQKDKIEIEQHGNAVTRPIQTITWDPVTAQRGGYQHYMLKEIHEQPVVTADAFRGRIEIGKPGVTLSDVKLTDQDYQNFKRVVFTGCGTAWHACLVGKYYLEEFAKIACDVDYASEFRYRFSVLSPDNLVIAVSQSGETADTLAAINKASQVCPTLAVCNVVGSSLTRKVGHVIYTQAGPEISVASTKAFVTQLVALYLFAIQMGQKRGELSEERAREKIDSLFQLPSAIDTALKHAEMIEEMTRRYHTAQDFLYIGRGKAFPIALEGAIKLKEISYIHAEGYPAGELKHGPLALIDERVPVVVVLQRSDLLFEKTVSNLREVEARGGRIIIVTDDEKAAELKGFAEEIIMLPYISEDISPIILTIPLQLIAYYIAVRNGTDVDLPRNLAKSVTVE